MSSEEEEASALKALKIRELEASIDDATAIVADQAAPRSLRVLARRQLDVLAELLDAVRADNALLAEELVLGTLREDGKRMPDGFDAITPYWARGAAVFRGLNGIVEVDESQEPVTVTVHWERLDRSQRRAAASLANELVDAYQGRKPGGRPRKSKSPPAETR